jgi:hypothetical protein
MTVPLRLHLRQHRSNPMQHASNVDVDHPVPLVNPEGREWGERHDAGVVDDHVDLAEFRFGEIGKGPDIVKVRDIESAQAHAAAAPLNPARDALQPVGPTRAEHDARATRREHAGCCLADAARRSSDQNNFVIDD